MRRMAPFSSLKAKKKLTAIFITLARNTLKEIAYSTYHYQRFQKHNLKPINHAETSQLLWLQFH